MVVRLAFPRCPRASWGARAPPTVLRRWALAARCRQPPLARGYHPFFVGCNRRPLAVTIRFSSVATAARWRLPSVVRRLTCDNRQGQPSWRAPDRCWLARPLPSATRHSPLVPWFGGVPELGRPGPCGRPGGARGVSRVGHGPPAEFLLPNQHPKRVGGGGGLGPTPALHPP